jgi:hypothetical protein
VDTNFLISMLCLLSSVAGALSTTTTVGRLQGQGRVVAVRPVLAEESGHLCIGDVCAPLKSWFDGPVAPRRRMPPLVKGFVSARRQVSLMSPTRITIIGAIVNMVLATMKIGTSPCQNTGPILPG